MQEPVQHGTSALCQHDATKKMEVRHGGGAPYGAPHYVGFLLRFIRVIAAWRSTIDDYAKSPAWRLSSRQPPATSGYVPMACCAEE